MTFTESQGYEIRGNDGKVWSIWARSDREAKQDATKWGYRHGGVASLTHLILQAGDMDEGCWQRATRREIA